SPLPARWRRDTARPARRWRCGRGPPSGCARDAATGRAAPRSRPRRPPAPARPSRGRRRCRPTACPWAWRDPPARLSPASRPSCPRPTFRPPSFPVRAALCDRLEILGELGAQLRLYAVVLLADRSERPFGPPLRRAFQRLRLRDDAPHLVHVAVAVKDHI